MTLAFNACASCLHFEGDTESGYRFLNGRLQDVYLHRCRLHPDRLDAGAVHGSCFVSRAAAEFKTQGFGQPVARTDGLTQGELL